MSPRPWLLATSLLLTATACGDDGPDAADVPSATTAAPATTVAPVSPAPATTAATATTVATTTTDVSTSALSPQDQAVVDQLTAALTSIPAGTPGCSIAVGRDGEVIWAGAGGVSDPATGRDLTPSDLIDMGSVSKQFTAAAVALLHLQGDIDVHQPVATYLPDLPDWAGEVTVLDTVQHTSGIPDFIEPLILRGHSFNDPVSVTEMHDWLSSVPELDFAPGSQWAYSNTNYVLLADIVEAVSGRDFADFVHDEVLEPAGVHGSIEATGAEPGLVQSYEQVAGAWAAVDHPWVLPGPGYLQTTPSDLVTWSGQLWDPTVGAPGIADLRFAEAASAEVFAPGARYGFGLISVPDGDGVLVTHSGSWEAYSSQFVVNPATRITLATACISIEAAEALVTALPENLLNELEPAR